MLGVGIAASTCDTDPDWLDLVSTESEELQYGTATTSQAASGGDAFPIEAYLAGFGGGAIPTAQKEGGS